MYTQYPIYTYALQDLYKIFCCLCNFKCICVMMIHTWMGPTVEACLCMVYICPCMVYINIQMNTQIRDKSISHRALYDGMRKHKYV